MNDRSDLKPNLNSFAYLFHITNPDQLKELYYFRNHGRRCCKLPTLSGTREGVKHVFEFETMTSYI